MNDNVEIPPPARPAGDSEASESATPARPARRRRTAATVDLEAASDDAAPSSIEGTNAEPAPKPRRRRVAAVTAEGLGDGALPVLEERPGLDTPRRDGEAASVSMESPRTLPATEDQRPDAAAPVNAPPQVAQPGEPSPSGARAAAPSQSDLVPLAAGQLEPGNNDFVQGRAGEAGDSAAVPGASREGEPAFGERGRRRNRRDRHRNQDRAAFAETGEEGPETTAEVAPPLPPAEVGEVFSQVVSGVFDAEADVPEGSSPPRRILAPDPEAPKLHKVLAQAGIGSRRDMEDLILDGRITVNGEPAHIGQRISFGDQVKVSGKPVRLRIVPPPPRIIAYHKPAGEIVTHDDPQHRPTVFRRLPRLPHGKWQSVGRLDINTEGLLLFTNSGGLANQLMHPRFGVEREYAVRVLGTLSDEAREELLEGVDIDGQSASFRSIEDGGGDGANHWYRVVITEGRNREVRRLFDAVGLTVSRLIRIRYGTVVLPHGLKRGVWTDLDEADVRAIRRLAAPEHAPRGDDRVPNGAKRNERPNGRNDRQRPGRNRPAEGPSLPAAAEERDRESDSDFDDDMPPDPATIPNPLEQTFDKRFVQNPRHPAGGRGFARGGGGFGAGGSGPGPSNPHKGPGPKQPDPLQTSLGYFGADAFQRKNRGGGGRGGNRGGSGFGGGGGGGFSGGGGGRRGR